MVKMDKCEERIFSFISWSNKDFTNISSLISAGFSYTGVDDTVICKSCGLKISNWKEGMVPLSIHTKDNGNCSFIRDLDSKSGDYYIETIDLDEETSIVESYKRHVTQDLALLEEENQRLKNIYKCVKCEHSPIEQLLLPCNHSVTCTECTEKLERCPSCEYKILGTAQINIDFQESG